MTDTEDLPLTPLSYQILLALADEERHGYGILKEIGARSGLEPSTGALYLAVQRMEEAGLIELSRSRPEEADERRKYYGLTVRGRRLAVAESERLARLLGVAVEKRLVPATLLGRVDG